MKNVLLHICCGVCASWPIEKLRVDGYLVEGIFYNPNIHPAEEYERRLEAIKNVADTFGFKLVVGPYDKENWFTRVKGLEGEPEGATRCLACFRMRLEYVSRKAAEWGFDYFATTLSVSPHKDTGKINEIGVSINPDKFLAYDFKKMDGFRKAMHFSKEHNLFRQNYCGCIFSINRERK
jgi:predicted adenine nucleotide alpha hydrolase (AANH) superfamily ATPase